MYQLHPSSPQHNYGTRIRRNSVLKPSARLRQSPPSPHPPPRRIKPAPTLATHHPAPPIPDHRLPVFPIPGVMLHPEDASNKVFHAIGRSFLAIENRAMTIKDLAEMTLKYGLMCQNVSAASQAITTYIRNHMARCEAQQDHPLLLRHVLSGTLSDDDLIPALYSRMGGATNPTKPGLKDLGANDKNDTRVTPGAPEGERVTNFRRGTMVWYLSKAAGVSCPFARAGIRLCEYGKEGRKNAERLVSELQTMAKKQTNRDEVRCGEKRKRLRRGCRRDSDLSQDSSSTGRDSQSPVIDSGYGELSVDSSDDERPPKVKLTLRLRPSLQWAQTPAASQPREIIDLSGDVAGSSSEDDDVGANDVDMRPDPPEVPWSLPPYPRRSISVPCYTPTCDESAHSSPFSAQSRETEDKRIRSPSVSWSASPPPDSDHDDFDLDSDVDWDSSSLFAPSPAIAPGVKVETTDDVRKTLDFWEREDFAPTSTVSSTTVKLPATDGLEFDASELWNREFESGWTSASENQEYLPVVKMEPDEGLVSLPAFAPESPASPCSSLASSYRSSRSPTSESGGGSFSFRSPLSPFALPTPHSSPSFPPEINAGSSALTWQDAELLGPDSVHPHEFEDGWASGVRMHAGYNLPAQRAPDESSALSFGPKEDNADVACAGVKETGIRQVESRVPLSRSPAVTIPDIVVVHTCRPCTPDVCATQIEGISVYQTKLGRTLLLRRIDTDFVNLSTILSYLSLSVPSPLPNGCINVSHPCFSIDGIWAPLGVARLYAHGLPKGLESIFLSDDLVMRFPTALQDFYHKSTSGRLLNQFGPHFNASFSVPGAGNLHTPQLDPESTKEDTWDVSVEAGPVEEPLLAIPPSVNEMLAALHSTSTEEVTTPPETPLSPTEQEIFRALCVHPDWETEDAGTVDNEEKSGTASKHSFSKERPLRRSRRVADAVAARSRVAPPRMKGPRHS